MTRLRLAVAAATCCLPLTAAAQISFEPETPAASETAPKDKPAEAPAIASAQDDGWSRPILSFRLTTRLSVSATFEGHDENVADFYRFATASIQTHLGSLRVLVTGRLRWVTTEEAPTKGPFWLFNGSRPRSDFEPSLGETSLSGSNRGIDWSVGLLDIAWGQNVAFSPADVLTPVDMRDLPLVGPDQRIPVPAVRVRGTLGPIGWDVVYLPVFIPSKLPVIGNNWSPYAVVTQPAIPDLQDYLDPTTYSGVQNNLLATKYPQNDLTAPQGGIRISAHPGPLAVALTWAAIFDPSPLVTISPNFRQFVTAVQSGNSLNEDLAALALQGDLQNGVAPLSATYQRTNVFAADAAVLTGPVRWTLDVGYSPGRVFPLFDLTSTVKPLLNGVAGLEWEGPPLIAAGVYSAVAFNVNPGEKLLFFDSASAAADRERNVSLTLGYVAVRETLLNDRLGLNLAGMVTFAGDFIAVPAASWHIQDAHTLSLGADIIGGPRGSFGAAYQRNTDVFVQYVLSL
jgi:hypothetical protein